MSDQAETEYPESGPGSIPSLLHRAGGRVADFLLFFLVPISLITLFFGVDIVNDEGEVLGQSPPLWGALLVVLLAWFYEAWFVGAHGQTLGKLLERSRVVDVDTGEPPGFAAGAKRAGLPYGVLLVGMFVLGQIGPLLMMIVYLSSALDDAKRGWHDKLAGTVVVRTR